MSEWKEVLATEYCRSVVDGTHDSPKQVESGRYLVTSKHIKGSSIDFSTAYLISEDDYQRIIKRSKVDQWDVIISMIGEYCGFCYLEDNQNTEYAVKNVGLLKTGNELNARWLYYYLNSPKGKLQLYMNRAGSTQPYISLTALRNLRIPNPTDKEKEKVTAILSSLDAKIENNNKVNAKLEEIAQNLFKEWFVDFGPFKDGKFVDSELGPIPEGWRVGTISTIVENTIAGDWGKETEEGNFTSKVACIRGADIEDVKIGNKGKMPTRYILPKNFAAKRLESNDLVIEISGGTPTQSTGRVCLISKSLLSRYDNALVCTNFCRALKPVPSYSMFLFQLWKDLYNKGIMFLYENGTTGIKNLAINDLLGKEMVVLPPKEVAARFEEMISSFEKTIQHNGLENEKLATLRDTLLPKLMSGEIEV